MDAPCDTCGRDMMIIDDNGTWACDKCTCHFCDRGDCEPCHICHIYRCGNAEKVACILLGDEDFRICMPCVVRDYVYVDIYFYTLAIYVGVVSQLSLPQN